MVENKDLKNVEEIGRDCILFIARDAHVDTERLEQHLKNLANRGVNITQFYTDYLGGFKFITINKEK